MKTLVWRCLSASALGCLSLAAFAPYSAWYVLPLCLGVLLKLALETPIYATGLGLAYGLGQFGLGLAWVLPGLLENSQAGWGWSLFLYVSLIVPTSLFPAFALWLTTRLPHTNRFGSACVFASAWSLSEYVRAYLGMPLLTNGLAFADAPWVNLASVIGAGGLGWLAACLAAGIFNFRIWLPATLTLYGLSLLCPQWTTPDGQNLRVRLMQGNLAQTEKFTEQGVLQAYLTYADLMQGAQADLIATPETAIPLAWQAQPQAMLDFWQQAAHATQATLLVGAYSQDAQNNRNSAFAIYPSSTSSYRYDKVKLAFLGEYLPQPLEWLGKKLSPDFASVTPGREGQAALEVAGKKVGVSICFETYFPARIAANAQAAGMLLNLSNFAWFRHSNLPAQHLQAARLRALENGRWLMLVENSGHTALISPRGQISAKLSEDSKAVLDADVPNMLGTTPYLQLGDSPLLIFCMLSLVWCARSRLGTYLPRLFKRFRDSP